MGAGTTVGTEKGRPGNWREPAADPVRPCEAPIRCEQSGSEALSSLGTFSNCGGCGIGSGSASNSVPQFLYL